MKKLLFVMSLLVAAATFADQAAPAGTTPVAQSATRADASQCVVASGTAQQTLTITPPQGYSVYITEIDSVAQATTAPAASAVTTTTTNFNATLVCGLTATAGISCNDRLTPATPIKSIAPTTAVTVVSNAAITNVTFTLRACFYFAL